MKPGKAEGEIVIENTWEQQTVLWALDPNSYGINLGIAERIAEAEAPIQLSRYSASIILDGLRYVVRQNINHPYHDRAMNMLDEYEIALL